MFTHMCTNEALYAEKQNWVEKKEKGNPRVWQILRVGLIEGREREQKRQGDGREGHAISALVIQILETVFLFLMEKRAEASVKS